MIVNNDCSTALKLLLQLTNSTIILLQTMDTRNVRWRLIVFRIHSTGLGMGIRWCCWNQNGPKRRIWNLLNPRRWTPWISECVMSECWREWRVEGDGKWRVSTLHDRCNCVVKKRTTVTSQTVEHRYYCSLIISGNSKQRGTTRTAIIMCIMLPFPSQNCYF